LRSFCRLATHPSRRTGLKENSRLRQAGTRYRNRGPERFRQMIRVIPV
jgi:hypothetical protein